MANQYVNKVILGEETLIDISGTTAVATDVLSGKKFFGKDNQSICRGCPPYRICLRKRRGRIL